MPENKAIDLGPLRRNNAGKGPQSSSSRRSETSRTRHASQESTPSGSPSSFRASSTRRMSTAPQTTASSNSPAIWSYQVAKFATKATIALATLAVGVAQLIVTLNQNKNNDGSSLNSRSTSSRSTRSPNTTKRSLPLGIPDRLPVPRSMFGTEKTPQPTIDTTAFLLILAVLVPVVVTFLPSVLFYISHTISTSTNGNAHPPEGHSLARTVGLGTGFDSVYSLGRHASTSFQAGQDWARRCYQVSVRQMGERWYGFTARHVSSVPPEDIAGDVMGDIRIGDGEKDEDSTLHPNTNMTARKALELGQEGIRDRLKERERLLRLKDDEDEEYGGNGEGCAGAEDDTLHLSTNITARTALELGEGGIRERIQRREELLRQDD